MPRIIVLVKVVPNIAQLRFDPEKKTLVREGVKNIVNPHDEHAVEEAVRIKERRGGSVRVVSMGPPHVEEVLRELYAFGVDEVYLLTDKAFAGADTLATSTTLALMCKKLGYDIVLGGKYSVDAETAQLIPQVAQLLDASLVTNIIKLDFESDSTLLVEREHDEGYETFEVQVPAVFSVSEKINRVRIPKPQERELAKQRSVTRVGANQLSDDLSVFGSAGSPTSVASIYDASYTRNPLIFDARTEPERRIAEALEALEKILEEKPAAAQTRQEASGDPAKRVWSTFLGGNLEFETAKEILSKLSSLGYTSEAVFLGEASDAQLDKAYTYGASRVIHVKSSANWSSKALADGLIAAIQKEKPYAVFFPSTVKGREVAGRVAAALRLGLTGDAVDLKPVPSGEIVQVKPSFGGNIMAEITSKTKPVLATVRPGVFEAKRRPAMWPRPKPLKEDYGGTPEGIRLVDSRPAQLFSDLYHARFVVCAGYGVGSPEGFREVQAFAEYVNAAVGATRKIVDLGWAPPLLQIGLTGKSISPDLYVAIGVSGATNHLVGVRRARVILAVNKDPHANIFSACDIGIVADYKVALTHLREGLRRIGLKLGSASKLTGGIGV